MSVLSKSLEYIIKTMKCMLWFLIPGEKWCSLETRMTSWKHAYNLWSDFTWVRCTGRLVTNISTDRLVTGWMITLLIANKWLAQCHSRRDSYGRLILATIFFPNGLGTSMFIRVAGDMNKYIEKLLNEVINFQRHLERLKWWATSNQMKFL